jgi:hypothetical protein
MDREKVKLFISRILTGAGIFAALTPTDVDNKIIVMLRNFTDNADIMNLFLDLIEFMSNRKKDAEFNGKVYGAVDDHASIMEFLKNKV